MNSYRLVLPFNEIYQFAVTWVVPVVFTGENDAEIMQNSVTVNLNVLEHQRILNETLVT